MTPSQSSTGTAWIGVKLTEIVTKDSPAAEVQISELLPGPAKNGGVLHINDVVMKVAGKSVKGLSANEVSQLLLGKPKSKVRVQVRRGRSKFEVTLIREEPSKGKPAPKAKLPAKEESREPRKPTPMEQARKVADGAGGRSVYKHSRRPELGKATPEEAERIRAEDARVKAEAQAIADAEYDKEKALREAQLKKKNEEGMKQLWNLVWYGDENGPPPSAQKKERWHKRAAKSVKQYIKAKKIETVAAVADIYIEHKVNKVHQHWFGEEAKKGGLFGGGEKKKKSESKSWFGASAAKPPPPKEERGACAPCAW